MILVSSDLGKKVGGYVLPLPVPFLCVDQELELSIFHRRKNTMWGFQACRYPNCNQMNINPVPFWMSTVILKNRRPNGFGWSICLLPLFVFHLVGLCKLFERHASQSMGTYMKYLFLNGPMGCTDDVTALEAVSIHFWKHASCKVTLACYFLPDRWSAQFRTASKYSLEKYTLH